MTGDRSENFHDEIARFLSTAPSVWPEPARAHDMEAIGACTAACHQNCEAWVQAHPSDRIVSGWIIAAQGLAARHSVIETAAGALLDVTPRKQGQSQGIFEFKRWLGSEEAFRRSPDQVWFEPASGFSMPSCY